MHSSGVCSDLSSPRDLLNLDPVRAWCPKLQKFSRELTWSLVQIKDHVDHVASGIRIESSCFSRAFKTFWVMQSNAQLKLANHVREVLANAGF